MIKNLSVEGLKSINKLQIDFKNLNLLVGVNSSGKSTIIQSILLASQNINAKKESSKENINGNLVSLGDFRELRNANTNAQNISISIKDENGKFDLNFQEENSESENENFKNKNLEFDKGLYYLSASRIGHMDTYENNIKGIYKFGLCGEYCLDYFEKNKNYILDNELIKDSVNETLQYNVNYWFEYIIGGKVYTEDIKQTDRLKAQFSGTSGVKVRTKNIGSGLSYLISIIIMCLSMKKGETLIIENPEIHLHPKAQSRLIEFFIFISKAERQLIIETHSDHFFNGLRVAFSEKNINEEDFTINFLNLDDNNCTVNNKIEFSKRGRIVNAPNDLFDQFEIDLDRMLGI